MSRIILGVIVGFVVWTIIALGGDEALAKLSGGWYSTNREVLNKAVFNQAEPVDPIDPTFFVIVLVLSVIASLLAGFLAAFVANENRRTPLALGVLLLIVGLYFQFTAWNQMPVWYHLAFLILLIPVTVAGGYLKKTK
ncbi:MAG: hypothetical protein ACKVRN_02240 [Pyrinomonadaceae bacterium]